MTDPFRWLMPWRPEHDVSLYWARPYPALHWIPLPVTDEGRETDEPPAMPSPSLSQALERALCGENLYD